MPRPITAVAFRPDAPLGGFEVISKTLETPNGPISYLDCSEAVMDGPFLKLTPVWPGGADLSLWIQPHTVLWMLQGEVPKKLGFSA